MDKFDKNKLLPEHSKLKYSECYAKKVLEDLFPEQFTNLELCDRPDLRDTQNNIGIEVTIAEDSKTMEAEKLYSRLPYDDERKRAKTIKRIRKCGASFEDGILFNSENDNFKLINQRIENKVKKLNEGQYDTLTEHQLFIFSSIYANDDMLKNELDYLQEHQIAKYFRKIYILVPGALFYFDLTERIYKVFEINPNKQQEQAQMARQLVEMGELDDRT